MIKLKNNKLLACYSELPLIKGENNKGKGFIASLSNKEVFKLRKNNPQSKVTLYDDYFILFGNSEVKIKAHEDHIESNLGIVYRYFDSGTHKNPEVLFGVTDKVETIDCYEVYQLKFAETKSSFL